MSFFSDNINMQIENQKNDRVNHENYYLRLEQLLNTKRQRLTVFTHQQQAVKIKRFKGSILNSDSLKTIP